MFEPTPTALPESLAQLTAELTRLPGIGQRTALRLALQLARGDRSHALQLARALDVMRERLTRCDRCFGLSESPTCAICLDPRRDDAVICVVEEPTDVLTVERAAAFRGRYHVLGGALSPLDGVDPSDLTLSELDARVTADGIVEVLVATNSTMTGEATASYIADLLRGRCRVTRPASGLPVGSDLDHADELTIGRALSERRQLD